MVPVTQDKSPATLHLFEQRSWNSYLFKPVELELTKNKWATPGVLCRMGMTLFLPPGAVVSIPCSMGLRPSTTFRNDSSYSFACGSQKSCTTPNQLPLAEQLPSPL